MSEAQLELRAAKVRRVIACGVLVAIGAMFWWSGMLGGDQTGAARALMVGIGALWFWGAWELWRGTGRAVFLTDSGLVDSNGVVIAPFDSILAVERGMISMKPSHGMLLKLSHAGPVKWVPGLWWRLGARVGIGGLTPKNATRLFADALELRLAEKDSAG